MIVSREKALKSCYNFWQVHNTEKGFPENYPDEEVVRFLMRLKSYYIKKRPAALIRVSFDSNILPEKEITLSEGFYNE